MTDQPIETEADRLKEDNVVDIPPAPHQAETPPPQLTQGWKLVGASFNPSGSSLVTHIKAMGAEVIDILAELKMPLQQMPDGSKRYDANHRMIIEEAIKRQIEATM